MTRRRHRPRRYRNPFRDLLWLRILARSWARQFGIIDLDREYRDKMREGEP